MYQQYSSIEQNDRKANVKRSPTLENQIESMLDGIIGEDNDNVSLHFSEEEDYKVRKISQEVSDCQLSQTQQRRETNSE